MTMNFRVTGQVLGAAEVQAKFERAGMTAHNAVRNAVERLGMDLLAKVKDSKLSGQVLNVKTGRLRRSINARIDDQPGSVYSYVGTNVVYARIHELGGDIHRVAKPGVVRLRLDAVGNLMHQKNNERLAVFAKASHKRVREVQTAPGGYVTDDYGNRIAVGKAYTIHMPERSFLRSSLADIKPEVADRIRAALLKALKGA